MTETQLDGAGDCPSVLFPPREIPSPYHRIADHIDDK